MAGLIGRIDQIGAAGVRRAVIEHDADLVAGHTMMGEPAATVEW